MKNKPIKIWQIKMCEGLLLRRRQDILIDLEIHNRRGNGLLEDAVADPLDLVDESRALELIRVLEDAERREIVEIDHALSKVASGAFGKCEWSNCADNIGFERLEVLPTARMCIKHQMMYEQMARGGQTLQSRLPFRRDGVMLEKGEEDGVESIRSEDSDGAIGRSDDR